MRTKDSPPGRSAIRVKTCDRQGNTEPGRKHLASRQSPDLEGRTCSMLAARTAMPAARFLSRVQDTSSATAGAGAPVRVSERVAAERPVRREHLSLIDSRSADRLLRPPTVVTALPMSLTSPVLPFPVANRRSATGRQREYAAFGCSRSADTFAAPDSLGGCGEGQVPGSTGRSLRTPPPAPMGRQYQVARLT